MRIYIMKRLAMRGWSISGEDRLIEQIY